MISASTRLDELNAASSQEAADILATLCTSTAWVSAMVDARPFVSEPELVAASKQAFSALTDGDWLDAFSGHPRIGDTAELEQRFAGSGRHSASEQAGLDGAASDVIERLANRNDEYYERYGHVFLICATGKTAAEMLAALEQRMEQGPDAELQTAAQEQQKITMLRIDKYLNTNGDGE